MRAAVIGIGSNSVRMLVADIEGDRGVRVTRERAATRLFAGLGADRRLSPQSMENTTAAVAGMADQARRMGAEELRLFATSATRDAANQDELAALLLERAGLTLEITPGEDEAALSYLGAMEGGFSGVIDIGGGSTEIIGGHDLEVDFGFSCQMGAVRLFRQYDIGGRQDMQTVIDAADRLICAELALRPGLPLPKVWRGTGGTFTALAALRHGVSWSERGMIHGTCLERGFVEAIGAQLADMTVEQRLRVPGLHPGRADIVVHGICILIACMRRLDFSRITVSEYGNLDGYLKRTYRLNGGLTNA